MGIFRKSVLVFICTICFSQITFAQNAIDSGWKYVLKGDLGKAEQSFREALDGSDAFRANLALSFLYEFKLEEKEAWKYYKNAFALTDNYALYLFAAKSSLRASGSIDKKSGAMELWQKLAHNTTDGFMQAEAYEALSKYYASKAQIDEAKSYSAKMQAVLQWSVIGPFENIAASGFDEEFFPEKRFVKNEYSTGKNGIPVQWRDLTNNRVDNWVDFESFFDNDQSVFYANNFVYSPKKQIVQLRLGTSGSFKVFLNDANVISCSKERNNDLDTYITEVTCNEGWNRLLIKTGYSEIKSCNFLLRITDEKGFPVSGLKYSTDAQNYNSRSESPAKVIGSVQEEYFLQVLKLHPEFPENYLLMSDVYCLNDKAEEAEEVLTQGLSVSPGNPIMLSKLGEVYARAGKRTEILTTYHKLEEINPNFLCVLQVNAALAYQNKNYPEYEKLVKKSIDIMANGSARDIMRITYYALKHQPKEMIDLVDSTYEKYPDDWNVVLMKANVEYSKNKDYEVLEKIVKKYTTGKTESTPLKELMKIYINLNRQDDYEKTMIVLHELEPVNSSYYYWQAQTHFNWQQYNRAEELMKTALSICPSCATYHEFLGDVYKAQGNLEACRKSYLEGIAYRPSNHKLRDKLNDVSPESPVEKLIIPIDMKTLIRQTDTSVYSSGKDVLLVLNDVKRRIFQQGCSENEVTFLYKILSTKGIKQMSEYTIRYYGSVQEFIFNKAVVIKKDGSEIPADRNDASLVFKSLDVNDYILIKYKIQDQFSGALAQHFWDEFYFSSYYPAQYIRYSLVCPEDKTINYKGQNFNATPSLDTVVNHERLLTWEMKDIPEINTEVAMPDLIDVSKILFLSSIPDWNFLSSWYNKISRSRVESSREIKEQVASLFDKNKSYSERYKARIIYDFITNTITYSSVSFRQSAFVPQKAKDVLVSKLGDCKDVAGLFIAMAREAGLQASFVLVNTRDEGRYENALPGLYFNHAIASVIIDSKPYLLDLTAKYYPFLSLSNRDLRALALPISQAGEDRIYTQPRAIAESGISRIARGEITADNSFQVHFDNTYTGECSAYLRSEYFNKDSSEQIKTVTENFSDVSTNLKFTSFTITPKDTVTETLHTTEDIVFKNFLTAAGNFKLLKMPWVNQSFVRSRISVEKRIFPLVDYGNVNSVVTEIAMKLPEGYSPVELPESFTTSFRAGRYSISYSFKGSTLTARTDIHYADEDISPDQYAEYKAYCNKIIEAENTQILLKKK